MPIIEHFWKKGGIFRPRSKPSLAWTQDGASVCVCDGPKRGGIMGSKKRLNAGLMMNLLDEETYRMV